MSTIVKQLKNARRAGVPLVAINTSDAGATVAGLCAAINGQTVKLEWDIVRGITPRGKAAEDWWNANRGDFDPTIGNPLNLCGVAVKAPEGAIVLMHLAGRWLVDPALIQGVWNLRDEFKADGRMLVLLGPSLTLPAELAEDVVVFDEPLPSAEELAAIVKQQHANAKLDVDATTVDRSVEALRGLSAFAAEQVTAMCLTREGIDLPGLWERKRQQIEQTPGLKVFKGGDTFADIGGLRQVKQYLADLMAGNGRPNAITWLDEIDKGMPGGTNDQSGVSQDQLGTILGYMEDEGVLGVMLVGPPGSGKSAIAKAAGATAGVPTVRMDLGACRGSLVGESEQRIRQALKVITSVSNGKAMFIATANSVSGLDSALKRRFPFIFYFDLPNREEKDRIWAIWTKRYSVTVDDAAEEMSDEGWSGANIQKCCECSWRLNRPLAECGKYIVACRKVSGREIETLRTQADGVFLSASEDGAFSLKSVASTGRKIEVE